MALAPAHSTTRLAVLTVLAMVALVSACGDMSRHGDVDEVLAQLRSAEPAARYEAVVRLGVLAPSQARRDGLASAVRDSDEAVRLMAGLVVIGDGPTEHTIWLRTLREPGISRTPSPSPAADSPLSPAEQLVYMDPWFAGTLMPGALVAIQDRDERVRALGERALKHLKAQEKLEGSASDRQRGAK